VCKVGRLVSHAETFGAPVKPHLAFKVLSYHGLHNISAKATACWRFDGWTTDLGPTEYEASVCRQRPLDMDPCFQETGLAFFRQG
jgi:hypothetical protein